MKSGDNHSYDDKVSNAPALHIYGNALYFFIDLIYFS